MTQPLSSEKNVQKAIALYHTTGWKRWFTKFRFWYAPFNEVEQFIPRKGIVLDLGCGEGIFANFLGISSPHRKVLGIEVDNSRLSFAHRSIANVSFLQGDITKTPFPTSNAISIIHVLHHLPSYQHQEQVLKMCYKSLAKDGKLIIVEINVKLTFKYFLTWFTDNFLVAWFFEKRLYTKILFRKLPDWVSLLEKNGFSCIPHIVEKNRPFANVILECKKQ